MAAEELEQKKEKCENLVRWRLLKNFPIFLNEKSEFLTFPLSFVFVLIFVKKGGKIQKF